MTDETPTAETPVTYGAETITTARLLALPQGAIARLEGLRKAGAEVSYETVKVSALREEIKAVRVTGPASIVRPIWRGMEQDLGIKLTGVTRPE